MQYLTLFVLVSIGFWFISQNARYGATKFLFVITGLYLIFTSAYDSFYTAMGIGLILPHLKYLYTALKLQVFIISELGFNAYYFVLSVYFKVINFFKWLKSLFEALKIYFSTKSFSSARDSYEKENPREEEFNYSSYEEKKQKFEEPISEDVEEFVDNEYKQFYSSDPYVVLGVNRNDDLRAIKKAYRELQKLHHPDLNRDRAEEATAIIQRVNDAYERLKKIHS